jgi:predicted alpha/beta hydrolase family esterase
MAHSSPESALKPTLIFVPFFGGESTSLKKHFEFATALGLQWKFVDLNFDFLKFAMKPISARAHQFGMKSQWADQIELVLNETPGPKILFSFSTPTVAAIECIRRRHGHDVLALIADGGPSGELWNSIMNLMNSESKFPTWALRATLTTAATFCVEAKFKNISFDDLQQFPENFQILSIRGWKDPLISPRQIDMVFAPHSQLKWQKLSLPEGGHLNGLKAFPEDYKSGVERFLRGLGVEIISSQPETALHV